MLQMRGIEPTEENIIKVATAKPKKPKQPSDWQLLASSLGSSLAKGAGSALGPQFGNWLGDSIFGSSKAATPSGSGWEITPSSAIDSYMSAATPSPLATSANPATSLGGAGSSSWGGLSGIASSAGPAIGALLGIYNTQQAYEDAKGQSVGSALSEAVTKPRFWLSPISGLGSIAGSLFG